MSILIKGRNMPENCQECVCLNDEHFYCQVVGRKPSDENIVNTRPGWCPLVPVPPHGDLIDRDAFIKDECNNCDGACESIPCNCLNCTADCRCDFIKDIADAPTIIPAEESET
jgi:hypothetical protein